MKRNNYYLQNFLIVVCIIFYTATFAQNSSAEFYFRHIRTEQGLSNTVVNEVMKDHNGFLWMATYNGLNSFDGLHFKSWKADPFGKNTLPSSAVQGLCEDKKGNIWCTTNVGISRFNVNSNSFENFNLINKKTGKQEYGNIFDVLICRDGTIVTESPEGIYLFDDRKNEFVYFYTDLAGEGTVNRNSIIQDPFNNALWIGTNRGMLYFDLNKKKFFNHKNNPQQLPLFNDHYIACVSLDKHNNLVYGDAVSQELITYEIQSKKINTLSTKGWMDDTFYISSLFVDADNNKWISTFSDQSFLLESQTGKLIPFKNEEGNIYSIDAENFNSVVQDPDGTLYFATNNGISYTNLRSNFFSIHILPENISHQRQYNLSMLLNGDRQNNLWLAPSYNKVVKYDPLKNSFTRYNIIPASEKYDANDLLITCMEATNDKLYFGTIDGIYVYTVKTNLFERLNIFADKDSISGRYILAMSLSNKGELWFTSHHNGVFCYDVRKNTYRHFVNDRSNANSFPDDYIFDVHCDQRADVWFCSEHEGLIKYNITKNNFDYVSKDTSNHLPGSIYLSMTSDSKNNLWISNIYAGTISYNPDTKVMTPVSAGKDFSNLNYNHILLDKYERLWMAYYHQFCIFNPIDSTVDNFEIDYSKGNTHYATRFCLLENGTVVSETKNGFILLDEEKRLLCNQLDPILVSNITSGNTNHLFADADSTIQLSSSQNYFSIDFGTLSNLKNNNIRFSYKLEGFDKDWIDCGTRQTAFYTNVSGGEYVFKVRARIHKGLWQESSYPVKISVAKVFYTTIWFKLLLLLVLLFCVFLYLRLLRRKELKNESNKAISYFANSMQGKNKVEEILWDIANNVITRTDMVDCVIYLFDKQKRVLIQKAAFGSKSKEEYKVSNPIEIPVGKGIVGSVAQSGIAEIIKDTSQDVRYIADDIRGLSEIAVPVIYEGEVIAVIDSEHPKADFFTVEHLHLLQTIASISGTKIINAQREIEIVENEKRMSDLKLQMADTRQQALRAQMNPHFIFNCLNSINGFILKNDPVTASIYLIKFSKLIRLILEHSNERSISLQSELDALKLYVEMESLRFEKKFSYEIKVDADVSLQSITLPPLIFQPYVENSIWHGLLHKEVAGKLLVSLCINGEMLECIIEDNGIGREKSAELKSKISTQKKSMGLKLTEERLALMKVQEGRKFAVKVEDVLNDKGKTAGTRVTIRIEITAVDKPEEINETI